MKHPAASLLTATCITFAFLAARRDASAATLLVANGLGDKSVHAFDATTLAPIAGFNYVPDPGYAPELLNIAVSGNSLYVAKDYNVGIGRYDAATGAPAADWTSPSGLDYPYGLAVAGNRLYVANYGSNTVGVYDATTGAAINASLASAVAGPIGVAILGNNLYVVSGGDAGTNRVGVYNATSGATINANFITGLNHPFGLTISGSSLFVANSGDAYHANGTVRKYDALTGAPSTGWTSPVGLDLPEGLTVADNRLYVANWLGFTVGAYNATTGAPIAGWTSPSVDNPVGVAVFTPAPEPGIFAMLGLGTLLFAARRRGA